MARVRPMNYISFYNTTLLCQLTQVRHRRSPSMRCHFRHHPYTNPVVFIFLKFSVAQLRLYPVTRLYGQVPHYLAIHRSSRKASMDRLED